MSEERDAVPISTPVMERLEALGVRVDRARERSGIGASQSVTTEQFFAFWRAVGEEAERADLGLILGAEAPDHGYSVASSAALHAPNLREALKTLARYKRLTCPEHVELEVSHMQANVRFHWTLATSEVPRLLVDSTFASFVSLARIGTGGKASPVRLELVRRAKKAESAQLRTHFGCPIVFGASVDRIVFAESSLDVPFVTSDSAAFSRVVPGLEAELVGRARRSTLRDEVRVAIARNMSSGARPTVDAIARRLRVSSRTLQRRLGEERTSYQEQLDQVRRTSARRLLANTELPPVDIAFLLGFEEPNSFTRAFRNWERTSPSQWRERATRA
jgi:AraC-like DNA-binding protein